MVCPALTFEPRVLVSWFPSKVVFICAEAKLLPRPVPAAGEPWRESGWQLTGSLLQAPVAVCGQRETLSVPCPVSLCFPPGLSGALFTSALQAPRVHWAAAVSDLRVQAMSSVAAQLNLAGHSCCLLRSSRATCCPHPRGTVWEVTLWVL